MSRSEERTLVSNPNQSSGTTNIFRNAQAIRNEKLKAINMCYERIASFSLTCQDICQLPFHSDVEINEIKRLNTLIAREQKRANKLIDSVSYIYTGKYNEAVPSHVVILSTSPVVNYIKDGAFCSHTNLRHIHICNECLAIGIGCFRKCSLLESIHLPTFLNSIGGFAFDSCKNLQFIQLPRNIQYLETGIFQKCTMLGPVIKIPCNVISIEKWAFRYCSRIETVFISSPIINISSYAFNQCESLKNIFISKKTCCIIFSSSSSQNDYNYDNEIYVNNRVRRIEDYLLKKLKPNDRIRCHKIKGMRNALNACAFLIGIPVEKYFRTIINSEEISYDEFYVFIDWSKCSKVENPTNGTFALHRAAMRSASIECLKLIYYGNPIIICTPDPVTGLELFMLAAANTDTNLSIIYFLLREYPQAIMNPYENDTNIRLTDSQTEHRKCMTPIKKRRV